MRAHHQHSREGVPSRPPDGGTGVVRGDYTRGSTRIHPAEVCPRSRDWETEGVDPEPRRRLLRVPGWVPSTVLSAFILLPAIFPMPEGIGERTPLGVIVTAVPALLIWGRHRWPLAVLAGCVACFCVAVFTAPLSPLSVLATATAMYALAVQSDRRRTLVVTIAVIIAILPVCLAAVSNGVLEPLPVAVSVTVCFAAALGDGVRSRRAYIAEITDRAVRAEATRESEAARRVSEERLRIARDLHDVVAHQITVISLNTSLASAQLRTDPDEAEAALVTVRTASRRVLSDIGNLLSLLRAGDEATDAPQPGLADLDSLIDEFRASGLDVTVRREDPMIELSPGTDSVAHRVIQEALTNALRHGSEGRAHVLIAGDEDGMRVIVTNPVDATTTRPATAGGYGLQGLRERVASVRGMFSADLRGGLFRVEATFPGKDES